MLVNLKQEVGNIFITISHSRQAFYFVIDTFRDGGCNLAAEVIKEVMPFSEELISQRNKRRDV